MNPTPEQIAQAEAEEREAAAFVDAQWKAADAWLAAEWPHASDETRAVVRSAWVELASRSATTVSQPVAYLVEGSHNGKLYAKIPHFTVDEARDSAAKFARHYSTVTTTPLARVAHGVPPGDHQGP